MARRRSSPTGCRPSRPRARRECVIGRGSPGRGANGVNCSSGARPCPSASPSAAAQHLVHERLLEEAHFRLRRVHVDVDAVGRNLDEQVHLRAALLDRRDAVGLGDRVRDRPVLDDAAVDEDVLRAADRALVAERRDVAVDRQARRPPCAPRSGPARSPNSWKNRSRSAGGRRTLEQPAAAARQREADLGIAERHLRHEPRDLRRLGGVGLQELAARRQVVEEVGDLDRRALGRADLALGRRRCRR